MLKKFTSFVCVGGVATAFQYLILLLLVELRGFSPVFSSAVGFFMSCILNYILNYRFTFKSDKKHSEAFLKFMIVACVGLVINVFVMSIFIDFVDLPYMVSQVIATIVVLIWNFFANLLWSFKKN